MFFLHCEECCFSSLPHSTESKDHPFSPLPTFCTEYKGFSLHSSTFSTRVAIWALWAIWDAYFWQFQTSPDRKHRWSRSCSCHTCSGKLDPLSDCIWCWVSWTNMILWFASGKVLFSFLCVSSCATELWGMATYLFLVGFQFCIWHENFPIKTLVVWGTIIQGSPKMY